LKIKGGERKGRKDTKKFCDAAAAGRAGWKTHRAGKKAQRRRETASQEQREFAKEKEKSPSTQ